MALTNSMSDDDIRALNWYYEVELRQGVFTKGRRFVNMLPTRKLLEHIQLSGLRVLDIGTMEGAFSVMLSRAGAKVIAYDRLMLADRVAFVKEAYGCRSDTDQYAGPNSRGYWTLYGTCSRLLKQKDRCLPNLSGKATIHVRN